MFNPKSRSRSPSPTRGPSLSPTRSLSSEKAHLPFPSPEKHRRRRAKLAFDWTGAEENELRSACAGELVALIGPPKGEWVFAKSLRTGEEGYLARNYLSLLRRRRRPGSSYEETEAANGTKERDATDLVSVAKDADSVGCSTTLCPLCFEKMSLYLLEDHVVLCLQQDADNRTRRHLLLTRERQASDGTSEETYVRHRSSAKMEARRLRAELLAAEFELQQVRRLEEESRQKMRQMKRLSSGKPKTPSAGTAAPDIKVDAPPAPHKPAPAEALSEEEKLQRKRQYVIDEMVNTERQYHANLQLLVDEFVEPMARGEGIHVDPADVETMFSNVKIIFNISTTLLDDLRRELGSENPDVGKPFLKLAPFFKMYGQYAVNHSASDATLLRLLNKKAFAAWIDARETERLPSGENLESLLIRPIQRVPRYLLLLKRLQKYTPVDHPQFAGLAEAIRLTADAADHIDKSRGNGENAVKIFALMRKLGGEGPDIAQPGLHLLRDGNLLCLSETNPVDLRVLLFSKFILLMKDGKYFDTVPLLKCFVKSIEDAGSFTDAFEIVVARADDSTGRYALSASSRDEALEWQEALQDAVQAEWDKSIARDGDFVPVDWDKRTLLDKHFQKRGYLNIPSAGVGLIQKRRWFVLRDTELQLFRQRPSSVEKSTPKKVFHLPGLTVESAGGDFISRSTLGYSFALLDGEKEVGRFFVPSKAERDDWVQAVSRVAGNVETVATL